MSDNPLTFLLYELPAYIEPGPLEGLMRRYEENKRAYARECRIRQAERMVRTLERRNYAREDAALARWRMKLRKLKEEST
jgi:hypothetical protein